MAVAEITVPSISLAAVGVTAQSWGDPGSKVVQTPGGAVYVFHIGSDSDLYYIKSADGGITWAAPVAVFVGTCVGFSVWYDKWTPDGSGGYQTGTVIHLAYWNGANNDRVNYRSLDTADDSLGTEQIVFQGVTLVGSANTCVSICKTRGGNLLVMFDADGGTEKGLYRSTDSGANWTVRTDPAEGADYFMVLPGYAADSNDAIIIFWDRSATEISRKVYDDSADSTAETSIGTGMTSIASTTCSPHFAAVCGPSAIYLVAWTNRDLANADLLFWSVTESAITAGGDVVTNSTDDQQCCAITYSIGPGSATIRVFYEGKSDGSETVNTALGVYYKDSVNGGTSFGSEQTFSNRPLTRISLYSPLVILGTRWLALTGISTSAGQNLYVDVQRATAKSYSHVGV